MQVGVPVEATVSQDTTTPLHMYQLIIECSTSQNVFFLSYRIRVGVRGIGWHLIVDHENLLTWSGAFDYGQEWITSLLSQLQGWRLKHLQTTEQISSAQICSKFK